MGTVYDSELTQSVLQGSLTPWLDFGRSLRTRFAYTGQIFGNGLTA